MRIDGTSLSIMSLNIDDSIVEMLTTPGVTDYELRKTFDSIVFKQSVNNMKSERHLGPLTRDFV